MALRGHLRAIKAASPDKKDACFKTLLAYITNLLENPEEPKFRCVSRSPGGQLPLAVPIAAR